MDRRSFPTTTDTSKLAGAVDPAAALKDLDSRNNPHSTIRVTTRFSGGELRQHQMNSNSSEPSTCPRPRAQAATFALILDQSRLNSQLIGTALTFIYIDRCLTERRRNCWIRARAGDEPKPTTSYPNPFVSPRAKGTGIPVGTGIRNWRAIKAQCPLSSSRPSRGGDPFPAVFVMEAAENPARRDPAVLGEG